MQAMLRIWAVFAPAGSAGFTCFLRGSLEVWALALKLSIIHAVRSQALTTTLFPMCQLRDLQHKLSVKESELQEMGRLKHSLAQEQNSAIEWKEKWNTQVRVHREGRRKHVDVSFRHFIKHFTSHLFFEVDSSVTSRPSGGAPAHLKQHLSIPLKSYT
eukprot:scaffold116673_cov16-Tisochrysis_lutea.AAC.2